MYSLLCPCPAFYTKPHERNDMDSAPPFFIFLISFTLSLLKVLIYKARINILFVTTSRILFKLLNKSELNQCSTNNTLFSITFSQLSILYRTIQFSKIIFYLFQRSYHSARLRLFLVITPMASICLWRQTSCISLNTKSKILTKKYSLKVNT